MPGLASANPSPRDLARTAVYLAAVLFIAGAVVAGGRVFRRVRAAVTALEHEAASESKETRQTAHALLSTAQQAMARSRALVKPKVA